MTYEDENTNQLLRELPKIAENQWLRERMYDFLKVLQKYRAAIREMTTKLEVLDDEFSVQHHHNPIHHIESRLKSAESITAKLKKNGFPLTLESLQENLMDIAGVRVICCYIDDIYRLSDMLLRQTDIELIARKDYIRDPKPNGYRSLHLVVRLPIFLSEKTVYVPVEVQIRTVAMDFWASLEHSLRYKPQEEIPNGIDAELLDCSERVAELDRQMQAIFRRIQQARRETDV